MVADYCCDCDGAYACASGVPDGIDTPVKPASIAPPEGSQAVGIGCLRSADTPAVPVAEARYRLLFRS